MRIGQSWVSLSVAWNQEISTREQGLECVGNLSDIAGKARHTYRCCQASFESQQSSLRQQAQTPACKLADSAHVHSSSCPLQLVSDPQLGLHPKRQQRVLLRSQFSNSRHCTKHMAACKHVAENESKHRAGRAASNHTTAGKLSVWLLKPELHFCQLSLVSDVRSLL